MFKKQTVKLKVTVIGSSNSSKLSLIKKIIKEKIPNEPKQTEQFQIYMYEQQYKKSKVQAQIWDCGSNFENDHQYLQQAFFKNSSATLIVFNAQDEHWQKNVQKWINICYANGSYLIYAIATKVRLNSTSSQLSNEYDSDYQIQSFFDNYFEDKQQKIQCYTQPIQGVLHKKIQYIFLQIHDEHQIHSRSTLGRAGRFNSLIQKSELFHEDSQKQDRKK